MNWIYYMLDYDAEERDVTQIGSELRMMRSVYYGASGLWKGEALRKAERRLERALKEARE